MVWYYIGIILFMRVIQSVCSKKNKGLLPQNSLGYLKYVLFYMSVAAFIAVAGFAVFRPETPLYLKDTFIYALPGGAAMTVACLCGIYNLRNGTMALNALFSTAGLLIPTIASAFAYGEQLSFLKILAVGVFFLGAYLLVGGTEKIYGHYSVKSIWMLFLVLVSEGITMLTQKLFGMNVPDGSVFLFTTLSFGSGAILMLVLVLGLKVIQGRTETTTVLHKTSYLYGLLLAVAVFLISQLATMSAPLIPAAVLFTIINGGAALISTVVGAALFHERLTLPITIGLAMGVGALILISI